MLLLLDAKSSNLLVVAARLLLQDRLLAFYFAVAKQYNQQDLACKMKENQQCIPNSAACLLLGNAS